MAIPTINFAGYLYDDAGEPVSGATVNLFAKNLTATSLANDTTDPAGRWDINYTTAGTAGLDIQIANEAGSSKRRIKYDDKIHLAEVDTALLNIRATNTNAAAMYFYADEGADAGDRWKFNAADGGVLTILNDASGQASYQAHVTITPNATASNSTVAVAGNLTVGNALTVTGTTTLNGNLVLGDAVASDTLTVGATLQGGTPLVFEGATADGHETSFVITDPTSDHNITFPDQGGYVPLFSASTATAVTTTVAELNLIDGDTARGTTAIADGDGLLVNDGGTMRMTTVETLATYLEGEMNAFSLATTFSNTVTVGVDDTGYDVKFFGASSGAYFIYDQSEDQVEIRGAAADATTSTGKLLLSTALTNINANDVIGKIDFKAPLEAGGTDAILVGASIQAVAQSTFAADSNATDLLFMTGHSEAAAEKFRITSQGELGIGGTNYGTDGQVLTSGGAGVAPAWESISAAAISSTANGVDNRIATYTGSAALNGEANLTFTGSALTVIGTITVGVDDTGHDVKFFGASAGAYMLYDQSEDQLVVMGASADATTSTGKLLLATSLNNINANDVLGKIEFQAPSESGGTDAITVAASIEAVAQGTFSASVNATDLIFKTGHSEVAAEKFRMTSQGEIGIGGTNYGTDGQVLTSGGAGAAVAWEDAGGGGTLELSNQGTIPAGAPVAIDSNGRATVISGLGSELALGSSHTTVADTVTNTSAKNYSYHYNSYATVLVDCGTSGVVRLTPDEGTSKIRGTVGKYSTSHANGYSSLGSREMLWGVETTMADASADIWGYYLNAVWDVDTSELVIMWIDASDSNKMKISFWSITNDGSGNDTGRLVTAGSTGTVANYACNAGKLVGLDYDKNANKYICAWSKNSGHGLYTSVWENSGGNPAVEITENQVTQSSGDITAATTTSALELKWANGGSGQDDIGLIVWEDAGDSSQVWACSMTHNDDDTIYHSDFVEPFGANTRVDFGGNTANRSVSYDTSTTAASGDFDSGDDLFLIAGAITDTDHMPAVVPIAAGGGGGTSPTISATGTVEKPFTAKPADWGGHSSGHVSVDDHVLDTLDGKNVSICYDPDRDCHVLIFRLSHYYMTDIDGGLYVNGQVVVSQTMNIHTDNTITNTYNTAYHLINGNRQNPSVEFANRSTNHNPFTYGFGRYGIEMMYHTTYNTMFIAGQDTILMDIDTEYEYGAHIMFAFNGNTTANGGSGALTYATSNIDRVAGLNTTAISDTGTAGTATITLPGAVNENVSGLTTGTKYYMGDSGTLTTNRPVRSRRWLNMGVATNATTKILVKADAEGQQH